MNEDDATQDVNKSKNKSKTTPEPQKGEFKSAIGAPAPDLQAQFEVLPADGARGWLGADSDVSLMIAGGKTGRRALWIFADTLIATFNKDQNQREWEGMQMPHSTVALIECGSQEKSEERQKNEESGEKGRTTKKKKRECTGKPLFHYRGDPGTPKSFFGPDSGPGLLWPVAGLASRDGKSVLLLAQRIQERLQVDGTTAITLEDVMGDDPKEWKYQTTEVPSRDSTLNWFSAVIWTKPEDCNDTEVYLFGHDSTLDEKEEGGRRVTLLAKADFNDLLLERDWSKLQFWTAGGWSASYESGLMKPLNVPSWETTCHWSPELQRWYTFNLDMASGNQISLWTAKEVTGEWSSTVVYTVPAPFSGPQQKGSWLCYAAKTHPELAEPFQAAQSSSLSSEGNHSKVFTSSRNPVELVFSWISNSWGDFAMMKELLFQPQGMSLTPTDVYPEGIRGYWPRFVRVSVVRNE